MERCLEDGPFLTTSHTMPIRRVAINSSKSITLPQACRRCTTSSRCWRRAPRRSSSGCRRTASRSWASSRSRCAFCPPLRMHACVASATSISTAQPHSHHTLCSVHAALCKEQKEESSHACSLLSCARCAGLPLLQGMLPGDRPGHGRRGYLLHRRGALLERVPAPRAQEAPRHRHLLPPQKLCPPQCTLCSIIYCMHASEVSTLHARMHAWEAQVHCTLHTVKPLTKSSTALPGSSCRGLPGSAAVVYGPFMLGGLPGASNQGLACGLICPRLDRDGGCGGLGGHTAQRSCAG